VHIDRVKKRLRGLKTGETNIAAADISAKQGDGANKLFGGNCVADGNGVGGN